MELYKYKKYKHKYLQLLRKIKGGDLFSYYYLNMSDYNIPLKLNNKFEDFPYKFINKYIKNDYYNDIKSNIIIYNYDKNKNKTKCYQITFNNKHINNIFITDFINIFPINTTFQKNEQQLIIKYMN